MSDLDITDLNSTRNYMSTPSDRMKRQWKPKKKKSITPNRYRNMTLRMSDLESDKAILMRKTAEVREELDYLMEKTTYYTRNSGINIREFLETHKEEVRSYRVATPKRRHRSSGSSNLGSVFTSLTIPRDNILPKD